MIKAGHCMGITIHGCWPATQNNNNYSINRIKILKICWNN